MHEYTVTKNIVKIVLDEASKANADKVLEIRLAIGEFSSFAEDSVKMYFDFLSEGTLAQNARVIIRKISAEFFCKACDSKFIFDSNRFECPKCGQTGIYDGSGKEFLVESIEIE